MNRRKSVTLLVLLFPLLAIPPAQARWYPGENLLTSFVPSNKDWSEFERKGASSYTRLWQKKGHSFIDSYAVSVMPGLEEKLSTDREATDAADKEGCEAFESTVLDESRTNGYPRLMWRTRCVKKTGAVTILQVTIQGRDSFYHVQKLWGLEVSEQEMALWQERLSSTSVCDTRDQARPCPEGFERVH
jgi:hypothetical protein